MDNDKFCKNCRYWVHLGNGEDIIDDCSGLDVGMCKRLPPHPMPTSEAVFPIVAEDSWCGEYTAQNK
jgi:hypothetical protein